MLTGVLVPSSGRVTVCGFNPVPQRKALARKIGVVFGQRSQLWWDLPLQDSYPILGAMHRMPEADWRPRFRELADQMDLGGSSSPRLFGNFPWASGCGGARSRLPCCTGRNW